MSAPGITTHSLGITSLYNRRYNPAADGSFTDCEVIWQQTPRSLTSVIILPTAALEASFPCLTPSQHVPNILSNQPRLR